MFGTLSWGDVYPGLADPSAPAPDKRTTDETSSAAALEGSSVANTNRPSLFFIAFAVLAVIVYLAHGE